MAMLTLTCPHCGIEKMTFDVAGTHQCGVSRSGAPILSVVCFCRSCGIGVATLAKVNNAALHMKGANLETLIHLNTVLDGVFDFVEIWPSRPKPECPEFVPPDVERAFLQAEDNRIRNHNATAAMAYRRALERAVKNLSDFETTEAERKANLAKVIKRLADANRLTPEISNWASEIKELGNDGAHDIEEPTDAEVASQAALTRMALIYLFEMPERVRRLREERPPN